MATDEECDIISPVLPVSNFTPSTSYALLFGPWYYGYNHGNIINFFVRDNSPKRYSHEPLHQRSGLETVSTGITTDIVQAVQQPIHSCHLTGFS